MDKSIYLDISSKVWFSLSIHGCFNFYRRQESLNKYIKALVDEQFYIYNFNCCHYSAERHFEEEYISNGLDNLGSLDDDYWGVFPDKEGNVFILEHFDKFFSDYPQEAINTLNTIREMSWIYLLFGKKLVVLLHSDDLSINQKFLDVGVKIIRWVDGDEPSIG